ncbi:MAG: hypothetical protein DMG13_08570 [Acidobacteria bacterium]|nr:MAG: hypothetical protein DMG13_08570 [Acidobacteriota bacterium]
MLCPKCAQPNDDRALYCQSCGNVLHPKAGPTASPAGPYAGFWKRFAAFIIDLLIIHTATGILTAITAGAGIVAVVFGPWIYEAWMLSSGWQATVGKRALGMVVTGLDGRRISFARATGRHFAKYISALILFIGFIMAAFTAKKQALHDMIAETLVIHSGTDV